MALAVVAGAMAVGAPATAGTRQPRERCPVRALDRAREPVEITFWHVQGQSNERVLQDLIGRFEAEHPRIRVELVNQVSYADAFERYRAGLETAQLPDLVQMEETTVQSLVDSRSTIPVGDCVDADDYGLSDFLPRALDYYTTGRVLRAMPWTVSNAVLIYDKNAFRRAGLDPEDPPATLDEVTEYSRQIVEAGAARHGIALHVYPVFNEFLYAKSGAEYVNHDNGRHGRATAAALDNPTGRRIWRWWDAVVDSGLAVNTGAQDGVSDHLYAVGNGDAAMTIDTSFVLGPVFDVLSTGEFAHVDPGVAPLPALEPGGGVPVGDGSLWIPDTGSKEKEAAAWELVKYLSSPQAQADFAVGSRGGYVPIRRSSAEDPELRALWAEEPMLRVPYEQLASGSVSPATTGSVIGDYAGVRAAVRDGIVRMLSGELSPREALRRAQREATAAIREYNERVGA